MAKLGSATPNSPHKEKKRERGRGEKGEETEKRERGNEEARTRGREETTRGVRSQEGEGEQVGKPRQALASARLGTSTKRKKKSIGRGRKKFIVKACFLS